MSQLELLPVHFPPRAHVSRLNRDLEPLSRSDRRAESHALEALDRQVKSKAAAVGALSRGALRIADPGCPA